MKNFVSIFCAGLFAISCSPDQTFEPETDAQKLASVPNTGMGLLIKHTGTNCYYCGEWVWVTMEQAIEYGNDQMLIIGAYGNHSLGEFFMTEIANELDDHYKIDGFPTFTVNGIKTVPDGFGDDSLGINLVNQALEIQNRHIDSSLDVGAALNWSVDNNVATINARFKFLKDCEGEYYATVWLHESGMRAHQEGYDGKDPEHKNVLRAAATPSVFGEILADGNILNNHLVEKTWSIDFPEDEWKKKNVVAAALVFKKVKRRYKFVNASWAEF